MEIKGFIVIEVLNLKFIFRQGLIFLILYSPQGLVVIGVVLTLICVQRILKFLLHCEIGLTGLFVVILIEYFQLLLYLFLFHCLIDYISGGLNHSQTVLLAFTLSDSILDLVEKVQGCPFLDFVFIARRIVLKGVMPLRVFVLLLYSFHFNLVLYYIFYN